MPRADKIILFTLLIGLLYSCKPYNSDDANLQMIQGKWMLIDAEREGYDSIDVDYYKQVTYLVFDKDKCTQQLVDLNETSDYIFSIQNFNLNLYKDSVLHSTLLINRLTADSLILTNGNNNHWKYIKKEQ